MSTHKLSDQEDLAELEGEGVRLECAHCDTDIGCWVGNRLLPDAGGRCPTCHKPLCRTCAGGWCSGEED